MGGKAWGEFVSGGSTNPDLQHFALHLLDLQVEHGFSLTFVWIPRDLNVRADYLLHVSAMLHHHNRLREEWFAYLDGLWGPHTVDRFATAENCQPLCPPHSDRFCSQYWHPDSELVDALSLIGRCRSPQRRRHGPGSGSVPAAAVTRWRPSVRAVRQVGQ